jgi:hypothetical protein
MMSGPKLFPTVGARLRRGHPADAQKLVSQRLTPNWAQATTGMSPNPKRLIHWRNGGVYRAETKCVDLSYPLIRGV